MQHSFKFVLLAVAVFAGAALPVAAQTPSAGGAAILATGPGNATAANTIEISPLVEAIDKASRAVQTR